MIYNPQTIEAKWRKRWVEEKVYQPDLSGRHAPRTTHHAPYYNLMMFPYPSAEGLHVGNMYAFTGSDVWGRYQRMRGADVFEPIGLDGFGIHSENYAIQLGKHPVAQAKISEQHFYEQLQSIGNGFAWDNRLETYDPAYYRFTQWLFVQMFKRGLAYRGKARVNWCPSCKTVLADEQVEDGHCERCKSLVERREMQQWFFKITDYADRLLKGLDTIDWPEKIKIAQRHWIGRKEGINITYKIKDSKNTVTCFTTTPVNFGATFIVVAPEHELVTSIKNEKVKKYVTAAMKKTDQQRQMEGKEKTGVFTSLYALNHVTKKEIPIWVADFVLKDVGTGAVQGCPGHDLRDFEFAKKFGLPIQRVVVGPDGDTSAISKKEQVIQAGKPGKMVNSAFLNGLDFAKAMQKTMDYFEEKGWGTRVTTYHLRDWLISRQRYWGPPIPMIYCQACADKGKSWFTIQKTQRLRDSETQTIRNSDTPTFRQSEFSDLPAGKAGYSETMAGWFPVPEDDLPVELPYVKDYQPIGEGKSPLEKAPKAWLEVKCPHCGSSARRETDVSDTFLDSSWYFLRYPSVGRSENSESPTLRHSESSEFSGELPWDPEVTRKWLPVDAYIGGAEHAVLHLLYSRFVWMALSDWKMLPKELGPEPFPFLFSHGLIIKDGAKMSKSRGNVVVPDAYIAKFGADTLRLYLMFLGSYDQGGDFRDTGIAGMYRFVVRAWELFTGHVARGTSRVTKIGEKTSDTMKPVVERTIKNVTERIERFKYNTAISALMELTNAWELPGALLSEDDAKRTLKLFAPFAPFATEELWQHLQPARQFSSIHLQPWPTHNEKLLAEKMGRIVIQINGRVRTTIHIPHSKFQSPHVKEEMTTMAKQEEKVAQWVGGKRIKQTIWVAPKGDEGVGILNLVV